MLPSSSSFAIATSRRTKTSHPRAMLVDQRLFFFILLLCGSPVAMDSLTPRSDGTPPQRPVVSTRSYSYTTAKENGMRIDKSVDDSKGMGVFTMSPIAQGAWMGQYTGEYLTLQQVQARYWDQRKPNRHDRKWRNSRKRRNQGLSGDYLFDMGNGIFLDGEDADLSSWCRFANHHNPGSPTTGTDGSTETMGSRGGGGRGDNNACNTETYRVGKSPDGEKLDRPQLWFKALRDIDQGEEILYDYGVEYWDQNGY
eukprot:scaffold7832_cov164-Amphora_coffeaeformis.AAC.2